MRARVTAINKKIHSILKDVLESHKEDKYRGATLDTGPMEPKLEPPPCFQWYNLQDFQSNIFNMINLQSPISRNGCNVILSIPFILEKAGWWYDNYVKKISIKNESISKWKESGVNRYFPASLMEGQDFLKFGGRLREEEGHMILQNICVFLHKPKHKWQIWKIKNKK